MTVMTFIEFQMVLASMHGMGEKCVVVGTDNYVTGNTVSGSVVHHG